MGFQACPLPISSTRNRRQIRGLYNARLAAPARIPRLAELAIALAVIVLDQLTKALVRRELRLYESHEIIPGLVSLVHGRNVGMAFGVLSGGGIPAQAIVLAVLSGI